MQDILIDTNVIIRLFDVSDPAQTDKAKRIFVKAKEKKLLLVLAPPVLFEVAWVLKSAHKRTNEEVLDVLESIIDWPGLNVLDRDIAKNAILLARDRKSSFADAYLAVTAQKYNLQVATFNKRHFQSLDTELYHLV
jgi:predicted nucleic acid-binding protein